MSIITAILQGIGSDCPGLVSDLHHCCLPACQAAQPCHRATQRLALTVRLPLCSQVMVDGGRTAVFR